MWWVCGLLLLASTINYMDRQTLANTSVQISKDCDLNEEQYGTLETAFGLAFAAGALVFGFIADRVNVRWLYPLVLTLWSIMGFLTGFAETYAALLWCRLLLGFFEAGHWPCALKTTQKLLPPSRRTLGNSVLQSGVAIGAMVTPLIIKSLVDENVPGSWRFAFQAVAVVGSVWVVLWLATIRTADLANDSETSENTDLADSESQSAEQPFLAIVFSRKFLVLVVVVVAISLCWHQFRVWMVKFLMQGRGMSRNEALDLNFWFNVMTDIGCLTAGVMTAALAARGISAHSSRLRVFGVCSVFVAAGLSIPILGSGTALTAVLLVVGAGALGLFPCYYALTQELSTRHMGKVTGVLGTVSWAVPAIWHREFGAWVDATKSFDVGMAVVCALPLFAWLVLAFVWPAETRPARAASETALATA